MPRKLWNLIGDILGRPARRRRGAHGRRVPSVFGCSVEQCEPRIVPAALSDLTATLIQAPNLAATGTSIKVTTEIGNLGKGASPKFQIEYRLSLDEVIDGQDILLTTVTRTRIKANGTSQFIQQVTLPANLNAGNYRLGIIVDPAGKVSETNEANNAIASSQMISITKLRDQLSGQVTYQKKTQPVDIRGLGPGATLIDPALTTWVVIHGRNQSSSSANVVQLAKQIDQYQPGDQVLLLDWTKAAESGSIGGNGENYIRPVAAWAAQALTDYGFAGSQINLVGYSWGALIAAETAEVIGRVNSILAVDPARDYPGGSYNPEKSGEVNLQSHAGQSWAFHATSYFPYGTATVAGTAEECFVVTGSDHFGVVSAVTSLLNLPDGNAVAAEFSLSELLTGTSQVTRQVDSYSDTGSLVKSGGKFDAVLAAAADGLSVTSLRYFDGAKEHTLQAAG